MGSWPDDVTAPAERARLADAHRRRLAAQAERTPRQALRLALLRQVGRRYRRTPPAAAAPQRILVIRPDHLGDLLFAGPALRLLRRQHPGAHIAALVGPWGEPVAARWPEADRVLTCPFPGFTRRPKPDPLAPYRLLAAEAARLRQEAFDLALVLRFDHWWGAWLAAEAGIPRRIGYAVPETRPFLTDPVPYVPGRHEVVQNLALALATGGRSPLAGLPAALTARLPFADPSPPAADEMAEDWRLRFPLAETDLAAADALLPPADGRPLVAIHPGSGAAVKQWRPAGWAAVARRLAEEHAAQVVFTGSAAEASLVEPLLAQLTDVKPPPRSLAGRTDLGALAAVYRRCALVIGPDSGPLHLAVAVGTPTVHLYGPVDRRTFGPWGSPQRHRVVTSDWACIPCNRLDWPEAALAQHGCVRDIEPEAVVAEAARLLGGRGGL
ncbi:MAG: glycosyltransferase family 9 protein [Caldilineales bacterium]|nr:glycosyltransferase family 9 protein [Caldilineales bacterium]MDW8318749.1 glycosyltransferase family 9 protein [Anaerolineae bacterium]